MNDTHYEEEIAIGWFLALVRNATILPLEIAG